VAAQRPPPELEAAWGPLYREFLERVSAGAAGIPVSAVTSWWRSRSRNSSVGGAIYSQHLLGFALDLVTPRPTALVKSLNAVGLVAIDEGDHVHVQAYRAGQIPPEIFAALRT
jgi:Peptidase M15